MYLCVHAGGPLCITVKPTEIPVDWFEEAFERAQIPMCIISREGEFLRVCLFFHIVSWRGGVWLPS